jgi:hypothetical protein
MCVCVYTGLLIGILLGHGSLITTLWVSTAVRALVVAALAPSVPFVLRGGVDLLLLFALSRYQKTLDSCWIQAGAARLNF